MAWGAGPALCTIAVLYAVYAVAMSRGTALPYTVVIGCLALGAWAARGALIMDTGLHDWGVALAGLGLVLGSFCAQLLGHALCERFEAPPHLFHGFVAAPVLESLSLQMRLGWMAALRTEVYAEVDRIRDEAGAGDLVVPE